MKRQDDPVRDVALLAARVALGTSIAAHGAQKMFGWFGGAGFHATIQGLSHHMPTAIALLVVLGETLGMIGLACGLFTRLCALGTTATMLGAIAIVHAPNGFFMNWSGQQAGEGFEYHLLALAVPLVIWGGGRWSVDTLFADRDEEDVPAPWREADALR